jgi:Uma2 family endonuclease
MQVELPVEQNLGPTLITFPARPSREEVLAFCAANPNLNFEVTAEGTIVIMAPAGIETSYRNSHIAMQLTGWATRDGRGRAFDSNVMFTLPNGAMRSPDASWIAKARLATLPATEKKTFGKIVPDFVIELKSPSDRMTDAQAKMYEWMDQGVVLGWLIDADRREVFIYRKELGTRPIPQKLTAPAQLEGQGPVAGFVLVMEHIWEQI